MFHVGATSDDVYHNEEDPPPFHENRDFDFGLDNKSIRRAFIRKVRSQCIWRKLKMNEWIVWVYEAFVGSVANQWAGLFFWHIAMTFMTFSCLSTTTTIPVSLFHLHNFPIQFPQKKYYTTVHTVQYISLIYYQRIWSILLNPTETTLSLCPARTAQSSKFIISIIHNNTIFKKNFFKICIYCI